MRRQATATEWLQFCYAVIVKTISQREMRNESGRVLREAEEGETFVVTRHGTPVARIVPNNDVEAGVRPARRPARFSVADLVHIDESIAEILTDLREDR